MLKRPRRLRLNENIRTLVRETNISKDDLIYPLFVVEGENIKREIQSMPNIYNLSLDDYLIEIEDVVALGIKAVLLFGIPNNKDEYATSAYDENGIVQRAIRATKEKFPELLVITDVCLCEYTSNGHCGIVCNDEILNDESLELLIKTAISHAKAGADIVAPSDMMDGRVIAIREALDKENFKNVSILSYSVKYASAFYGPFRDAADSAPTFGDRKTHQMDCANVREAIKEALLDIEEGADILMVKPALSYLDVIKSIKEITNLPLCAYNVSGEYSMVKAAAQNGWIDEKRIVMEIMTSIKRAGADIIITYHAKEIAKYLEGENL